MKEERDSLRVFIICDDTLARVGLTSLLRGRRQFRIVGEVASDSDFSSLVKTARAEVVLWNLGIDP